MVAWPPTVAQVVHVLWTDKISYHQGSAGGERRVNKNIFLLGDFEQQ